MASRKPRLSKELPQPEVPDTPQQSLTVRSVSGLGADLIEDYLAIVSTRAQEFAKQNTSAEFPARICPGRIEQRTLLHSIRNHLISSQLRERLALDELVELFYIVLDQAPVEQEPLPLRDRSTLELANDVLEKPGLWLRTPNPRLGDRKPIDLLDTDEEHRVRDILIAVDQGLF